MYEYEYEVACVNTLIQEVPNTSSAFYVQHSVFPN